MKRGLRIACASVALCVNCLKKSTIGDRPRAPRVSADAGERCVGASLAAPLPPYLLATWCKVTADMGATT